MIVLKKYIPEWESQWDEAVLKSRAGNFLHLRKYMDYHADRFRDGSLLIERAGQCVAVFPASLHGESVISHGGLTYAGLLANEQLRAEDTLEVFEKLRTYYLSLGIRKLIYKAVPHIFKNYPAEEDLYALYRVGACLWRRDISSVIDLRKKFKYSKGRKWSINKADKAGMKLQESQDFSAFHALLTLILIKFDTRPTHTLEELTLLKKHFPDKIKLYEVLLHEQLLAGAVVYDFGDTVHTQYLAVSEEGREIGALDWLIANLIEHNYAKRCYFSFGISTENNGKNLNAGLIAQKEGFGARAIAHDFYEWVF